MAITPRPYANPAVFTPTTNASLRNLLQRYMYSSSNFSNLTVGARTHYLSGSSQWRGTVFSTSSSARKMSSHRSNYAMPWTYFTAGSLTIPSNGTIGVNNGAASLPLVSPGGTMSGFNAYGYYRDSSDTPIGAGFGTGAILLRYNISQVPTYIELRQFYWSVGGLAGVLRFSGSPHPPTNMFAAGSYFYSLSDSSVPYPYNRHTIVGSGTQEDPGNGDLSTWWRFSSESDNSSGVTFSSATPTSQHNWYVFFPNMQNLVV